MKSHKAGETIRFTNASGKNATILGTAIKPDEDIEVTLTCDWNEEEGLGEGGPWGWGGFTTYFVKSLGTIQVHPDR